MAKRVGMMTELDEATMAWLEGHHIRPKDVKAWNADGRVGDLTTMTVRFHVSGVDEMPETKPMVITFSGDVSGADVESFAKAFKDATRMPLASGGILRQERETHSDLTMAKVRVALASVGLGVTGVRDAIAAMQNQGILFRERA